MSAVILKELGSELERLKNESMYREMRTTFSLREGYVRIDDASYLNLCSNNYLGISEDLAGSAPFCQTSGFRGATASRLLVGNYAGYSELERLVADLKRMERALVFGSGYMANIGVIPALLGREDAIFSDRLCHASIIDGIRLSGARHFRYRHNDMQHLQRLLESNGLFRRRLIVTEALFSMDGDFAELATIVALKEKYDVLLMVDEAHSGGIYGEQGAGLVNERGLQDAVDVHMGTFSKAYGSYGAYVAGSRTLIEYLVNKARSLIYTTGLPPDVIASNIESVKRVCEDDWRRRKVQDNAQFFRDGLQRLAINTANSCSQIVPWIIGDERKALAISQFFMAHGILGATIRPPTVPRNSSRIRFSITAAHNRNDLCRALECVENAVKRMEP